MRVFFFIGHEEKWFGEAKLEEAIREEQRKYDDIVYLEHIKENMDEGKTFEMFSWIANNLNSQYVMKADDDSYIIIPNILKRLSEVENMFSSPGKRRSQLNKKLDGFSDHSEAIFDVYCDRLWSLLWIHIESRKF